MPSGYICASGYEFPPPEWLKIDDSHFKGDGYFEISVGTTPTGLIGALTNVADRIGPKQTCFGFGSRYDYRYALSPEQDVRASANRRVAGIKLHTSLIIENEKLRVHFVPLVREQLGTLPASLFNEIDDWYNKNYTPHQDVIQQYDILNKTCNRLIKEVEKAKMAPMVKTEIGLLRGDLNDAKRMTRLQLEHMFSLLGEPIEEKLSMAAAADKHES